MVSEKKIFLSFSHYKSMGAIYRHGGHLDLRRTTICTYFQSPLNTRLHIKFEDIWPRSFRGEVVQRCERMDIKYDFASSKLLHAHVQYVLNESAKCQNLSKETLQVNLISPCMHYFRCIQNQVVKNTRKRLCEKNIFSASYFFLHLFNISLMSLQSIKLFQQVF